MRRGGNWSWKWFAVNAVAWFGFMWTMVEAGSYFELDFFTKLKSFRWKGLAGMVVAALLLSPGTYLLIKLLNGAIRRKLEEIARNEQKISPNCRLILDEKKFNECKLRIAREANEYLFATGSRSGDKAYLDLIEKRLRGVDSLVYTRVLFGDFQRTQLEDHCTRLANDQQLRGRVKVCKIDDLSQHTEAFIVLNEKEALVVIPSLNAIGKFDTGLVMKKAMHKKVRTIVESYARAGKSWSPSQNMPGAEK